MNKLGIVCTLVFLASCFATPTPTVSPPITPTAISPVPTPLAQSVTLSFRNGGFERPYIVQGAADTTATGWRSYHDDVPPCMPGQPGCLLPCPSNCTECKKKDLGCFWASPEWAESWYADYGGFRVRSGQSAQKMFVYGREGNPKLWQQVDVLPGTILTFSVYMMGWQCFDNNMCNLRMLNTSRLPDGASNPIYDPVRVQALLTAWGCDYRTCQGRAISDRPYHLNMRVGIDTLGIVSPTASSVVWSPLGESWDVWSKFTVATMARTNRVTLWVEASPTFDYIRTNNDVNVDDAELQLGFPAHRTFLPTIKRR